MRTAKALIGVLFILASGSTARADSPPSPPDLDYALIRPGATEQITIENVCKRLTNKLPVTIGIEIGSQAKWPDELETAGNLEVQPCR